MDQVISPIGFYLLLALGAVGVCLALPRKGVNPQPIGAVVAAAAAGLVILLLGLRAQGHLPNLWFYVFSLIALGASLRVISHPRPVYAALYFILTILSTSGLFVILAAEFVAFALVIVYAGAILITYLFVIMLATQAPSETQVEARADYDAVSREPVAATVVGFILLAALTTMVFRGVPTLAPGDPSAIPDIAARLPGRYSGQGLERVLEDRGMTAHPIGQPAQTGAPLDDAGGGATRPYPGNVEQVAFAFLAGHAGAIELSGVILLMAMLGAVVLARKQVEMGEEAKRAATLSEGGG
ncbi:MAG: NADH-quinone oxidoreductase subunit J [Phycisphaerales bacterium]|nr:NADH-quinone oxidoreductase subunit J [Phycisphaerales bacterium]